MAANQHYLLQLIGLGLVLITVGILAVGHAQAPHGQDAVDIIPHPGILLFMTGRQQPRDGILLKKRHKMIQQHPLPSSWTRNTCLQRPQQVRMTRVSVLALPPTV